MKQFSSGLSQRYIDLLSVYIISNFHIFKTLIYLIKVSHLYFLSGKVRYWIEDYRKNWDFFLLFFNIEIISWVMVLIIIINIIIK